MQSYDCPKYKVYFSFSLLNIAFLDVYVFPLKKVLPGRFFQTARYLSYGLGNWETRRRVVVVVVVVVVAQNRPN